ncbi:MAG TPA: DUF6089 family protein [Bacteroidia bacterium]|nr:DUF6089 family protein [Bacteroidia bacterium]
MKKSIILLLFLAVCRCSFSQSAEIGIILGISSYKGDLNGSLFNPGSFHPAIGVLYRHCYNNHWSYKLGINYGHVSGDDAQSNDPFQQYRNLSFRSSILEAEGRFEFNFFPFQTANRQTPSSPFLFAGLGFFKFNPQADLRGNTFDLQPLGTEGQGTAAYPDRNRYKRVQVSYLFGGGYKFRLSNRFGITIEAGARKTSTDYLDDVSKTYAKKEALLAAHGPESVLLSDRTIDQLNDNNNDRQRGDAAHKDWYMIAGVSLNFTLSKRYNDTCKPFKRQLH